MRLRVQLRSANRTNDGPIGPTSRAHTRIEASLSFFEWRPLPLRHPTLVQKAHKDLMTQSDSRIETFTRYITAVKNTLQESESYSPGICVCSHVWLRAWFSIVGSL